MSIIKLATTAIMIFALSLLVTSLECPKDVLVQRGSVVSINCSLGENANGKWYFGTPPHSSLIAEIVNGKILIRDYNIYDINEDASLVIKNVQHKQEGSYTIEHLKSDGTKATSTLALQIGAAIFKCREDMLVKKGSEVIINCGMEGKANGKWYFGTTPYTKPIAEAIIGTTLIGRQDIYDIKEDLSLVIKNIQHEQEWFYTIEHLESDGTKERSTLALKLRVSISGLENIFTASNLNCPKTVSAKEGSEAMIRCGLINNWYRETAPQDPVATTEEETIQMTDNNIYAFTEDVSFTINHLRHEQEGSYYIEYITPDGEKQTRMVDVYIRASFHTCRDIVSYEEGRTAIINCNLVGRNVKWYKGTHPSPVAQIEDGTMSVANCKIYRITEDGSLIINQLRREQEGVYIVEHVSSDGEMVKQAVTVRIEVVASFLSFVCKYVGLYSVLAWLAGILAIILVIGFYRAWASQPARSVRESGSNQNTEEKGLHPARSAKESGSNQNTEEKGLHPARSAKESGSNQNTEEKGLHPALSAKESGSNQNTEEKGLHPARSAKESGSNQNTEEKGLHPGKTSLMEAYNQNICPIPLPWPEYFLATDGEKKTIQHDQLISNTNLYAEMQVLITWPDGKTEQMSTYSFFQSDKSKTVRRVLFVGDIGCGKTSFVKQVSLLFSQMKTDEIFLFFLNLQNTNLNGNMAEEISKQLPEDCKIENIEFIIKNERCLLIFDGSNEFSDLNSKLGRKESGEQSYLTFQKFIQIAEVNNNVRIWLTSRPCFPSQFRDSFAVVNFLSFEKDDLKSYIKQMCIYYKTLKEQVQFPIKNFQELSRGTEVEPHGNDDVNVISRSVWSILEKNDLLKLDEDALLMGIVIQLLVSSKYGIMNKHTVGIDLTSFPSIIKGLVKCLYLRHVVVTKHILTATAIESMELMIGRLFLKENTLSIEQLKEGKRDISLLCGILKICPNSGEGKFDKDSTNTSYGFRCRHQFIQELCVAKYVSTDEQKLRDFRKSSNKNDAGRKKRILMFIDNN
ncbi:uncharacterized protein [Apostichopus japonicus]|uniref:uncharacterized protein isoform X8 n=1 Tax=Stichopus japonicus TaxID=307972 RepID=UPI003AB6FCBB